MNHGCSVCFGAAHPERQRQLNGKSCVKPSMVSGTPHLERFERHYGRIGGQIGIFERRIGGFKGQFSASTLS